MTVHQGGCLCRAIRYETLAEPFRVTTCYCKFCQRVTGAPGLIEPIFRVADFHFTAGTPRIYEHRSEGSGKLIYVNFCPVCSVKLMLGFERFPDLIGIYAGSFDDPGWFDIKAENSKHIFLDEALDGTIIPAGFAAFRQHATLNDGTPLQPVVYAEPHIIGTKRRAD